MDEDERIRLLEGILVRYVDLFGFIDEARCYYIGLLNIDARLRTYSQ